MSLAWIGIIVLVGLLALILFSQLGNRTKQMIEEVKKSEKEKEE